MTRAPEYAAGGASHDRSSAGRPLRKRHTFVTQTRRLRTVLGSDPKSCLDARGRSGHVYVHGMRLLLLVRHGQSLFNVDGVVNGDPARDRGLSRAARPRRRTLARPARGRRDRPLRHLALPARAGDGPPRARRARRRPSRTRSTPTWTTSASASSRARRLDDYRAWKHDHAARDRVPRRREPRRRRPALRGRVRAAARARPRSRSSASATRSPCATRSTPRAARPNLDGPMHDVANATPYLFEPDALAAAIAHLRDVARAR